MKRASRLLAWALVAASLAGCAAMSAQQGTDRYWLRPGMGTPADDAVSLLHYFDYVQSLDPAAQAAEKQRRRDAWASDPSDFHRLQYAIALDVAADSGADRREASRVLEPLATDAEGHEPELQLLARLLYRDVEAQRRLEAMKELRKRLEAMKELEKRLEGMKELERKLEAMKDAERKLEAMKEIERRLLQRGRATPPGAKP